MRTYEQQTHLLRTNTVFLRRNLNCCALAHLKSGRPTGVRP